MRLPEGSGKWLRMRVDVRLTDEEIRYLGDLLNDRSVVWQMRCRGRVLLVADSLCRALQCWTHKQLAAAADCNLKTVGVVLNAYRAGGVAAVVPPAKLRATLGTALDEEEEQQLFEMLQNERPPPDASHGRWTLRLAAREFAQRSGIHVSRMTVARILRRAIQDDEGKSRQ